MDRYQAPSSDQGDQFGVRRQLGVGRVQAHWTSHRLRHQQTIERIAVVRRQVCDPGCRLRPHRQLEEACLTAPCATSSGRTAKSAWPSPALMATSQMLAALNDCVAWTSLRARECRRLVNSHTIRTYSGRPSSSMRFSALTAMATSVARRLSVCERSPLPMTRLKRAMSASTRARQL